MYTEADLLPLSGLQHLVFCERQWGLIHLEQQWEENRLTAEGRLLHRRADNREVEERTGVRIVRALQLSSYRLGLSAQADVVEFRDIGPPLPVEYKRGRPKRDISDEVQLCAQGLCLEEMLGIDVPEGAIYYSSTRRRTRVRFTSSLRRETETLAQRMHELYEKRETPAPVLTARCRSCSLVEICQPGALTAHGSARTFLRRSLRGAMEDRE